MVLNELVLVVRLGGAQLFCLLCVSILNDTAHALSTVDLIHVLLLCLVLLHNVCLRAAFIGLASARPTRLALIRCWGFVLNVVDQSFWENYPRENFASRAVLIGLAETLLA